MLTGVTITAQRSSTKRTLLGGTERDIGTITKTESKFKFLKIVGLEETFNDVVRHLRLVKFQRRRSTAERMFHSKIKRDEGAAMEYCFYEVQNPRQANKLQFLTFPRNSD